MKVSLYSQYPRIVGYPIRQIVLHNINELNEHIKEFISKCDIHLSLYTFATLVRTVNGLQPDYESAIVNKVFLDLDEGNWLKNAKDLHNWCMEKDILHRMHLSSYVGIHFFIGCNHLIRYKKVALYNFQGYLSKKFNILLDKGISTMGDIARSFRIENTFNFKRYCYCVPLKKEELMQIRDSSDPLLKKLTLEPRREGSSSSYWYGHKLINLRFFDKNKYLFKVKRRTNLNIKSLLSNGELEKMKIPYKDFPSCIQSWMNTDWLGYKGRYLLTLYLRDQTVVTLTDTQIVSIIKNSLCQDEWTHCATNIRLPNHNPGENLLPIKKTLSNLNYKCPSCFQLDSMGFCYEKCGRWSPIYN